ncbi:MAG: cobalamin-dependent protein [Candidatus Omnitrophota bacterium]
MTTKRSPLLSSLLIINTLWVPAAVYYFINHVGLTKSLGLPFAFNRFIDPAISLTAKIVFLSWLWGLIIETLTRESKVPRLENFKSNLKKTWWITGLTMAAPHIIYFLIFLFNGKQLVSARALENILYIFTAYWAAGEFLKIKYQHKITRHINDLFWSWPMMFYGTSFLLISALLHHLITSALTPPFIDPLLELALILLQFLVFAIFIRIFIDKYPEITEIFHCPKTLILVFPPAGSVRTEAFAPVILRRYPPLFNILRALTPAGYRVIEYNLFTWRDHFFQGNALVAITCFTPNSASAYHIAKEFRRRGAKVVLGGPHVTFFPKEALEFCDSVVVGRAESVWEQVVMDYETNSLKPLYQGFHSEEAAAKIHTHLLNSPEAVIANCLQTSAGCKFNCHFCCATALTEKNRVKKSIAEMMPLLQKLADKKMSATFIDNNIYEDPVYAKELFRAMIPLKMRWAANASINIAQDDEALALMKASRCSQLLIGYEIADTSDMKNHAGKFTLAPDYVALTKKLKQNGILMQGQFIFGFPGDSWRSLFRLWHFCFKLTPSFTVTSFLTPLPGSAFFEESMRNEKILNLNWRSFDLMRQVVETPNLKKSWALQNMFSIISLIMFLTTSLAGRTLLVLFIYMEYCYFAGAK